ncbi:DUF6264 family protein [Agromyces sp. MMS24-JH15]|uniref:DUF6264 family protein n=1 Tax=Agromyces sp. MMS24-JH15 TaxID=3243765 RepID=UPI003747CDE7
MSQDEAVPAPGTPAPDGPPATPASPAEPAAAPATPAAPPAPRAPAPVPAPQAPPVDDRPRPRYGEYAPPGWTWQPPGEASPERSASATTPAAAAPAAAATPTDAGATPPPAPPFPASAPDAASLEAARPHPVDRVATLSLLVFGAFGAWNAASSLLLLPASFRTAYEQQGIGEFTAPEWMSTLTSIGVVVQLALYAAVLGWSILRLRRRRIAFWVPLAGGVVSTILLFAVVAIVFLNDPTFLSYMDGLQAP